MTSTIKKVKWQFDGLEEILSHAPEDYEFLSLHPTVFDWQFRAEDASDPVALVNVWLTADIQIDNSLEPHEIEVVQKGDR